MRVLNPFGDVSANCCPSATRRTTPNGKGRTPGQAYLTCGRPWLPPAGPQESRHRGSHPTPSTPA